MTVTEVREEALPDETVVAIPEFDAPPPPGAEPRVSVLRPLLVAGLSTTAAALMTGGIFGSWSARLVSVGGGLFGLLCAWVVLRSATRRVLLQLLFPVVLAVLAIASTLIGGSGESPTTLIGDAVKSGRVLRPPVPFDVGWRPILLVLFAVVGFAAAWLATALKRPQGGLVLPLPILALTAISQPAEGQFIAAVLAGIPLLGAFTVIFGGDSGGGSQLSREFEIKRLVRSLLTMVPILLAFVVLAKTSFLFPSPVYKPGEKPQKPKAIPLSAATDRVLFEVDGPITGPWRIGALDVYDGRAWRLPPFDPKRLKGIGDGVVDKTRVGDVTVKLTVRDLGDSATLPTVATPAKVTVSGANVVFDPRTDTLRVKKGRVPAGLTYTITLPKYPTGAQLEAAPRTDKRKFKEFLDIPKAPPAVADILAHTPDNPWLRLDALRSALNKVVIATGPGVPRDVTPARVQKMLVGNHEASPFDIVAAEAMFARWSGVPSRIGFGFDGVNDEAGKKTVRPKNAAQFLEVNFPGYGWVPIVGAPPKAKENLNTDKNAKFDPSITPSGDVAVELKIPIEVENYRALYQQIRALLLNAMPIALLALLAYLGAPYVQKTRRLSKRRKWAEGQGPVAQIAVEYAEIRELAADLGVGDPYDTPLEFLNRVVEDDEHTELAWLTTRALYGDLNASATPDHALAARELAESLRKRIMRAQPFQVRVFGILSRASLAEPYSDELPNVRLLRRHRNKHTVRTA